MKNKLCFLAIMLLLANYCAKADEPETDTNAVQLAKLSARVDSIGAQAKAVGDSVKKVQTAISQVSEGTYIADQDAIDRFNRKKDSIYQNSSYGLLSCRKCAAGQKECKPKSTIYSKLTFWFAVVLLLFMWYQGIKLFRKSTLCKDSGVLPVEQRCYSYSRVQLFFWTMIILTLYIYFFAFTGMLLPLNSTSVILLGMGIAVYSGGRIIDSRQQTNLGGGKPERVTEGLLTDILSDESGVTIHRFQSLVFNLIFGIGFFLMFLKNIKYCLYPFPDFSEWQFALLGISSAAYLGLKTTEYTPQSVDGQTGNSSSAEEPTVKDTQNM